MNNNIFLTKLNRLPKYNQNTNSNFIPNTNNKTNSNNNTNNSNNNINNSNNNTNNIKTDKYNPDVIEKYNPDVVEKYKKISRNDKFEYNNVCYKPITDDMPISVKSAQDFLIKIDKNDNLKNDLFNKYEILQKERDLENEIVLEMQKKFKLTNMETLDETTNNEINMYDDNVPNTFVDLKESKNKELDESNVYNNKSINDILNRLKDLDIDIN